MLFYTQLVLFFPLFRLFLAQHFVEEPIYTVNGMKALHLVDEKFVSFSIDPAVLLTGLNLSDTTLQMAKKLSPAYIRIAGPSTQFVKYQDDSDNGSNGFVVVTSMMWYGINEWLSAAKLTPIFGINDVGTNGHGWDPEETTDLLHVADKFNVSCYWQLGYDCSNKSEILYREDLKKFQHILDSFPNRKSQWKIVGSDLSQCVSDPRRVVDSLGNILTAMVLENAKFNDFHLKPKVPLWVTSPKWDRPISFAAAISWAQDVGEAAKNGFQVVLKQPRLHEIFSVTAPFWVSVLHKKLMGKNVLDIRNTLNHPQVSVYAHCTKHQNDFIRSGAMTVFIVNNHTSNHTILLKFGTLLMKSTEVQSYILTSEDEESRNVYLNGEKLSLDSFKEDKLNVAPKLRRARIINYLSLSLPPKSVGFFVLPSAQIPVCANEENDMKQIIEEIRQDQKIPFEEVEVASVEVSSRLKHRITLKELQENMAKELEADQRYSSQFFPKRHKNHENDSRNLFIQNMKKQNEGKMKQLQHKEEPKKIFELELSSAEIRKVLADRAKSKAAKKNIIFTSGELEEIMEKATQKFLNNKNASIRIRKKSKRETRDKKDINMRLLRLRTLGDRRKILKESLKDSVRETLKARRSRIHNIERRDINMQLLKLKSEMLNKHKKPKKKENFENFEEKQATIGLGDSVQIFDDLPDSIDEKQSDLPDKDVFAELADDFEILPTTESLKPSPKISWIHLPNVHHKPKIDVQPLHFDPKEIETTQTDFEVNSSFDDRDEAFDCIHEFFGKSKDETTNSNSSEIWEIGLQKNETKKVPIFSRIKEVDLGITDPKIMFEELKEKTLDSDSIEDYDDLDSNESLRFRRSLKSKNLRKPRTILGKNRFNERYQSLTKDLKMWKPIDILTLPQKFGKKHKRSVDHDLDSVENEIGNFVKEVMKDSKIDLENGDYQLVFPNKDKIEVLEKAGNTEMKFVLRESKNGTEKGSHIQKIAKHNDNVWDKLFKKLSKFFQGLSSKLKKCIMEDLLNS